MTANFLFQPLSTIYHYFYNEGEGDFSAKDLHNMQNEGEVLTDQEAAPIIEFINTELKLNISKVIFKKTTKFGISAVGSFNRGVLWLTPEFLNEIKDDLTPKHKFSIAHEMGHFVYDDCHQGTRDKYAEGRRMAVAAYTVSLLACSSFGNLAGSELYQNLYLSHIASCLASKIAEFWTWSSVHHRSEFRADSYAGNISPEIAQGGIEHFRETQQRNIREGLNSYPNGDRSGPSHPLQSERILNLQQFLKK